VKFSVFAAALLWAVACGRAGTLSVPLTAGQPVEVVIDSAVDDRNFEDPRGYNYHGQATRVFARRLTLTNTGSTPLTGQLLVAQGQDWTRAETLPASFVSPSGSRARMLGLFAFWRDHISHADSDAPGGKEPLALLNFWSYALCGDTTAALTRLAAVYGVAARKIPLNGHVAAEYFFDDGWHILDSDQNVAYLRLDNRTLASAADLRADPLLARRTKVFGRYAVMDIAASAFNTSLHEFIEPKEEKPVAQKTPPLPVRVDTLFPGEQMIIHADQAPEQAVGRTDLGRWGTVRDDALRVVEYVLDPGARSPAGAGEMVFASGYPILRVVNHTTGEIFTGPAGQPIFELAVKFRAVTDRVSVFCQRAKASLPRWQKGRNIFLLAAHAPGTAELAAEWESAPQDLIVPQAGATLGDAAPTFRVQFTPRTDLLWWQVSATRDFAFVPPNFDAVCSARASITFDPLTATFLNPDEPLFFRVKARLAGVWGEWSAPREFRVDKPARPAPARATVVKDRLRFSWPDAGEGCEYLVFGSNRRDFLPEPFAAEEIVILRNQGIEKSRPNKNLLAVVTRPEIELEPSFRYYRVLTRRAGAWSVPGDLLVTPRELTARLPPPLILQDRWQRVSDADEHLATEMGLPER